jgi:Flp pilus assembly pilin Flp
MKGVAHMAPEVRISTLVSHGSWAKGVPMFQRLWRDQDGASLIEYSILAALITVIVVVAVSVAGSWTQGMWAHLLPLLG